MNRDSKESIDWFMSKVSKFDRAYRKANFAFVAHETATGVEIVSAQLALVPVSFDLQPKLVRASNFIAQRFDLLRNNIAVNDLLTGLQNNRLLVPGKAIDLAPSEHQQPTFYRTTTHEPQVVKYSINAHFISRGYQASDEDDWLLRAAATPYNGVSDLRAEFGLLDQPWQFEAIALPPIAIDQASRVSGDLATVSIRVAKSIPKKAISLGLMVMDANGSVTRTRMQGPKLDFSPSGDSKDVMIGTATFPVPRAANVCCTASVGDEAMQWMWIGDPKVSQNPHRVIMETVDPALEVINSTLNSTRKKAQANDYEIAVAGLLWILGFSTLNIGGSKALSDGPDVVAISSTGQVLIVECTTGGLKTDNKLQNLLDRTRYVQEALEGANFGHLQVLPVLATPRSRQDVEADAIEYERRGVAVFTREDVEPIIAKTMMFPDSTRRFEEIRSHLSALAQQFKKRDNQAADTAKQLEKLERSLNRKDA